MQRDEWAAILRKHAAHHSLSNAFDISKRVVGKGTYSEVYMAKCFVSKKRYALKTIRKERLDATEVSFQMVDSRWHAFAVYLLSMV